jgi:integrase
VAKGKKPKAANGSGSITWDKERRMWRARGTIPDASRPGESKRASLGYFRTKDEAQQAINDALSLSGRRRLSMKADRTTVSEYLSDWLKTSARSSVEPHILRKYEQQMEGHVVPYVGSEMLADLKAAHVRLVKAELLDRGLAPGTVAYTLGTLSTALNQAVADELIPSNPVRGVKRPKARGSRMRVLDEGQAALLVASVEGTRFEALYAVAVWLGPRAGELCALKWEDVELGKSPAMVVRRSVSTYRAGEVWSATKTGEEREIPLPPKVAARLQRHRAAQARDQLARSPGSWADPALVFPNAQGSVTRHASLWENFHRHRRKAGLPEMRFHDLRHTAITLMLKGGVDVRTVAEIAGHSDPAMTLRRYAHVIPDMRRRAALSIDSYAT